MLTLVTNQPHQTVFLNQHKYDTFVAHA